MTRRRLLDLFGRTRRTRSWAVFGIGAVGLLATVAGVIPKGLDYLDDQAVVWLLVMLDGLGKAEEVEQDLDTAGAVDADDAE